MDINREVIVSGITAEQMFKVVSNVDDYQNYVPYCSYSKMEISAQESGKGRGTLVFESNKLPKKITITTDNDYYKDGDSYYIRMKLYDSPFLKKLNGLWTFSALESNSCKVSFSLDYSLNFLLLPFKSLLEKAFLGLMDAFVQRARERHG